MQTIPLTLAEPGMIIAMDIPHSDNPTGPPICGKGVELTELLLERLVNMGVQTVTVKGHPVLMEGEETLEGMLARLDHRFSMVDGDPRMMALKDIYRRLIQRSMGEDGDREES